MPYHKAPDPPYNVPIDGHVCGLGRRHHLIPHNEMEQVLSVQHGVNGRRDCRFCGLMLAPEAAY